MAKLSGREIQAEAVKSIRAHSGGIRFTELVNSVAHGSPEPPRNTVMGSVWNLDALRPDEVRKPSRGLYQPTQSTGEVEEPRAPKVLESEFYDSFAEWLRSELDEVT